jgi:hypothetical protein
MKIILKENNKYALRFDRGEEAIEGLRDFCEVEDIGAGWFWGIGAAGEVVISFYDIGGKEYLDKTIKEDLEIAGFSGNAAKMKEEVIIHCHGIFSDKDFKVAAGHVKKLVVSATCEIFFEKQGGRIERQYDEETGLNLMA